MVWLAKWKKAKVLAKTQLDSGASWDYMQKIIKAQNAVHNVEVDSQKIAYLWIIDSEKLPLGRYQKTIIARQSWVVKKIDIELLKSTSRMLWAPLDKQAWFYLNKQVGDGVEKWDVLFEVYSSDDGRLKQGLERLEEGELFEI